MLTPMPEKKPKMSSEEQFAYTLETHTMRNTIDWYTLNISPSIMRQHYLKDTVNTKSIRKYVGYPERKILFYNEWKAILRTWEFECLVSDYVLYLEISNDGLLHWHGKVRIKDVEKFNHKLGIYKYFEQDVRIEVKPITDDQWDTYITKDHNKMQSMLSPSKAYPIITDTKPSQGFTPLGES